MSSASHPHPKRLSDLESRIGYTFGDKSLLELALTHNSLSRDDNYERLEFFGDRILGVCVCDMLYSTFGDAQAGELSRRLNSLVSNKACSGIADEIGLRDYVRTEIKKTKVGWDGILGDAMESLIAAIYLDGGLDSARDFVVRHWTDHLNDPYSDRRDPKTELQEWSHKGGHTLPVYRVADHSGPDHAPLFVVGVFIEGFDEALGESSTKREAEQFAARAFLVREGVWES